MSTTTHVLRGTLYWAKVLGKPRKNTYTDENEWSVDVTPDAKGLEEIKRLGISDKLKNKDDDRKDFISFRQRESRVDAKTGERLMNRPIRILDVQGNDWPQDKLIGNGSVADVKFTVKDNGRGKRKGAYIVAIRVLDLVPYQSQEFAPLDSDDEYFAKGAENTPVTASDSFEDDLDDDVPF